MKLFPNGRPPFLKRTPIATGGNPKTKGRYIVEIVAKDQIGFKVIDCSIYTVYFDPIKGFENYNSNNRIVAWYKPTYYKKYSKNEQS